MSMFHPTTAPILLFAALMPNWMLAADGQQTDAFVRLAIAIVAAIIAWLQGRKQQP